MTREQYEKCWQDARLIWAGSRLGDVRRAARRIAMTIESVIGQMNPSAEYWKVD